MRAYLVPPRPEGARVPAALPRRSRARSPPAPPGSRCGRRAAPWTQPPAGPGTGAAEGGGWPGLCHPTKGASRVGARRQPAPGVRLPYLLQEEVQQPRSVPLQVKCGVVGQRHDSPCDGRAGQRRGPQQEREARGKRVRGPGDAHRRGRSTVPEAVGGPGRRPGGSGRPGAAAETRRSTAASGRGGTEVNAGKRSGSHAPQRGPGLPSRCPRSRLAHLGVAADAARRVGAGLGAHSQRARPVEAQAALAGRQESGQVLVARERLRAVASPAAGERGESLSARAHARGCRMPRGRARRTDGTPALPRLLTWPTAEMLRTCTGLGPGPSATRKDPSRGKRTSS